MAYKFNPFTGNLDEIANYAALNLLGTVANAAALPGSATTGDVYQAEDTGVFYVWDGAAWDNIGTLAGPQGPTGPTGPAGADGADGANGADGADGVGVVAGGTTGQALVKASNTDYDTQWSDVTAVAALDDLTDVVITTPSDGQVLEYDSATSQWVNATPTGGGGGGTPGGSDTQIQFNDAGSFGGDVDLTWNKTTNVMTVTGDVNLSDGGANTTTLQTITPTQDNTISLPNATGTVALVAGSNGQLVYNNAGAYAGASGSSVGASGDITLSANGAASTGTGSAFKLTGSWYTGANPVPQVLIQPAGTATSTTWSTSGTGLGVNAASGFTGNLLDLQVDGSRLFSVSSTLIDLGGIQIEKRGSGGTGFPSTYSFIFFNERNDSTGNRKVGVINAGSNAQKYGYLVANDGIGYIGFGEVYNGGFTAGFRSPANDIIEQHRTTNAQTYRLYNTYTDASNYERAKLAWNSNVFEIGTEGAGTGSEQPVRITAATLKLPNLPTYADNTAATSGGLVAGDVYKTSTGELRITV